MAQLYDANGNPFLTDVVVSGTPGALNATVTATLRGQACATVQVTAIGSLTLTFEGSTDGTNFNPLLATPIAGGAPVSTTTTNGQWVNINTAGLGIFRVRVSAYTSGTATVSVIVSQGSAEPNYTTGGIPKVDVASVNGTALGTPTNFGTSPGAVVAESANASLFVGTTAVTAAIAGAPDVNAKAWGGTALGTPTNFGTTPGAVVAGSVNSSAFIGTTVAVAASAGVQKVGVSGATGATMDAVVTAATAPASGLAVLVENVTTAPSLTTGQSVMAQADYQGSLFVKPYRRGQTTSKATTISATGATTILAAQAAGIFADITQIVITTAGLAAQTITISDGTLSWIIDFPDAAVAPAGPFVVNFDPPLAATTAATAWTANQSLATACHYLVVAALQKAS